MRPTASGYALQSNWGQPMLLKANSYRLSVNPKFSIRKYAMAFTPEIPDNSKVIFRVTKSARDKIKEQFGAYCVHGCNLFSVKLHKDPVLI